MKYPVRANAVSRSTPKALHRRRLLACAPPLLLAACTSIPVSTIWRMRSFNVEDFLALDAAALRAAVQSDPRVKFSRVEIDIMVQPKEGTEERHVIRLDAQQRDDPRLQRPASNRRWTVFALDSGGVVTFERVRQSVARVSKQGGRMTTKVTPKETDVPPELATRLPLRLDLLLDPKEGWFTLVRESEVDITSREPKKSS